MHKPLMPWPFVRRADRLSPPALSRRDRSGALRPIELVHHIEQMLGELVRRHARQQQPADVQVSVGTVLLGDERISRLLDAVVQEFVCALLLDDEPGMYGLPECACSASSVLP